MKQFVFFITLLLGVHCEDTDTDALCTRDIVMYCLGGLQKPLTTLSYTEVAHLSRASATSGSLMLTLPPPAEFDQTCKDFRKLDTCLSDGQTYCDDFTRSMLDGIEASYNYLCTEAKEAYTRHAPCVLSANLTSSLATCATQYWGSMTAAARSGVGATVVTVEATLEQNLIHCTSMTRLISCLRSAVKSGCGDDAATFWGQYIEQKVKFVKEEDQCVQEGITYDIRSAIASNKTFLCSDGSNIVPKSQMCDGIVDCLDGTDEFMCPYAVRDERITHIILYVIVGVVVAVIVGVTVAKCHKDRKWLNKLRRRGDHQRLVEVTVNE